MKPKDLIIGLINLIVLGSIVGCSSASPTVYSSIPGLSGTLAVQTMVADPALAHLVFTPTPQPEIVVAPSTPTPESVVFSTEGSSSIPASENEAAYYGVGALDASTSEDPAISGCSNAADFIKDVSIPDDTIMAPGQDFTKIWRFENVGTCTWSEDYRAVQIVGDAMNSPFSVSFDQIVPPGESIDIAVEMTAPIIPSCYQGNWILQDEQGNQFGTGSSAKDPFWVAVTVMIPGMPWISIGRT